jgi:hypothetical protein
MLPLSVRAFYKSSIYRSFLDTVFNSGQSRKAHEPACFLGVFAKNKTCMHAPVQFTMTEPRQSCLKIPYVCFFGAFALLSQSPLADLLGIAGFMRKLFFFLYNSPYTRSSLISFCSVSLLFILETWALIILLSCRILVGGSKMYLHSLE